MDEEIVVKQDMFRVEFGDELPLSLSTYAKSFHDLRAVFNTLAARYLIVIAYKPNGDVLSIHDNSSGMDYRFHHINASH